MMVAKEKKRAVLPYGVVITRLLHAHRVFLANKAQMTKVSKMNETTLPQMQIVKGPVSQWPFISPKNQGSSSSSNGDNEDEIEAALPDTDLGKIMMRIALAHKWVPSGSLKSTTT